MVSGSFVPGRLRRARGEGPPVLVDVEGSGFGFSRSGELGGLSLSFLAFPHLFLLTGALIFAGFLFGIAAGIVFATGLVLHLSVLYLFLEHFVAWDWSSFALHVVQFRALG